MARPHVNVKRTSGTDFARGCAFCAWSALTGHVHPEEIAPKLSSSRVKVDDALRAKQVLQVFARCLLSNYHQLRSAKFRDVD